MVAFAEVKESLLTLDQVRERLEITEPLTTKYLSQSDKIRFAFDPGWALALDTMAGTAPVNAVIRVNGKDHQLTKDAALQAGATFGIPGSYARKVPSTLLEPQLNYWYSAGLGDREFNMLSSGPDATVAAFSRPTINPYSNKLLLDNVLSGIQEHYGDMEIFVDSKMSHSLIKTDLRLILPEVEHIIHNGGMADVPVGADDVWSAGINFTNSLIGKSQTKLEGYLFRWWCANGAITQMPDVKAWSRRGATEEEDVYEWARQSIDNVLGGLEEQFEQVQALTQLNVSGNVGDIVREIFDNYDVPVSQRQPILDTLIESENMTMYSIMNAVTSVANLEGLSSERVDKLMRIGGDIPSSTFDTLKAKVWREGHSAGDVRNPYEITALTV